MSEIVWLGYAAGFLTSICFIPQVIKSFKTKETKDLSFPMLLILLVGLSLWLIYGIVICDTALIAANSASLSVNVALMIVKLRYG